MEKTKKEMVVSDKIKGRLLSLDVFRGATIAAMIMVNNPGSWSHIYGPLRHADWHGWTFTDLIFPFFLFIVGVAIVYAFSRHVQEGMPKKGLYIKIIRRTLILFALGIFLNGFPFFELSTLRIPGVLQRIAVCYFFTAIIFLHTDIKGQVGWTIGLLLAYWGLMEWVPVPGIGAGLYEKGANFSNYVDGLVFGNHVWQYSKPWDPEGLISTLPAISTTLFGVLTGHWLRSDKSPLEKTVWMLLAGNFALWLGTFWNYWLPINKNIWTSSYTVAMAGLALIVLAFCYFFIDVRGYKRWSKPFIIYGINAITVYVLSGVVAKLTIIIKVGTTAEGQSIALKTWLYQNVFASWLSPINASLAYSIGFILVMYLVAWIMYKKNIFIKI
jgi:predicted acyltransferase